MKFIAPQISIPFLSIALAALIGISWHSDIAAMPLPESSMLLATAYTDITLPTLRRGNRGGDVKLLQKILSDDYFLHAAAVRLGNPSGAVVDGVFGPITEAAVSDLQRHHKVPVTGQVNPQTWEVLDMYENPYRAPLPWKKVPSS
jgi:peptidoglycan hydrolase-like protein with peptidoglycan-binding domain